MGKLIEIRGKKLYVETQGSPTSKPLLYLHGGPGSSCYDFMLYQGEPLSKDLYLIGIDQRGVLRSDAIEEEENFGVEDLIEDIEALRLEMGITRWSVLGHSFGGYLATLYASTYSNSVDKLIFECPSFDFHSSLKSILSAGVKELEANGGKEEAQKYDDKVTENLSPDELMNLWLELGQKMGASRENLYIHGHDKEIFNRIFSEASTEIQERLPNTATHFTKLHEEQRMYQSVLPELQKLNHKMLMLYGKYDFIFDDHQETFFHDHITNGRMEMFTESAHFPRIEEPEKFTNAVLEFLLND